MYKKVRHQRLHRKGSGMGQCLDRGICLEDGGLQASTGLAGVATARARRGSKGRVERHAYEFAKGRCLARHAAVQQLQNRNED